MEAGTVFTTVSLMMFANGLVLAIVSRDLPATLRPAIDRLGSEPSGRLP